MKKSDREIMHLKVADVDPKLLSGKKLNTETLCLTELAARTMKLSSLIWDSIRPQGQVNQCKNKDKNIPS